MRPTSAIFLAILAPGCLVDTQHYLELRALLVDDDGDGWTEREGDCDDADPTVHLGSAERCNGVDDDCDGSADEDADVTWYPDLDGDTYGDVLGALPGCDGPAAWVTQGGDCDDADANAHPGAAELCNLADDDCDGTVDEDHAASAWYADADGDGHGDATRVVERCMAPEGYVALPEDCDDTDADVHPDAVETCEDDIDDDCDGGAAGCTWAGTEDTSAADARLLGDRAGVGVGYALAAGDVDGVGYDDLLVGSAGGQGAWLYAGDRTRLAGDALLANTARTSLVIDPTTYGPDYRLGSAVTLCDFDDDGILDLVVTGTEAGARSTLFVFDGGERETRTTADALYATEALGDLEGAALGCDDVNGDGADDILAGTPAYDTLDAAGAGALQVLYGGGLPDASAGPRIDYEAARSATYGEAADQALGASLAPFDFGADGNRDLLAGAGGPGGGAPGLAWLLTSTLADATAEPLFGPADGARAAAVAAGDLDGDGYDDLVVGVSTDATRGATTGAVYVVSGALFAAEGEASAHVDGATVAVLVGATTGMDFGTTVAVIPEADGAPAMLVVGAGLDDGGGVDAGAVYLWEGRALEGELTSASATATWRGEAAGDGVGRAVSTVGDLDGDGYFDLALGAPGVDDPASGAGALHLLYGSGY